MSFQIRYKFTGDEMHRGFRVSLEEAEQMIPRKIFKTFNMLQLMLFGSLVLFAIQFWF